MPVPLISGMGAVSAAGLNIAETIAAFRLGCRKPGAVTLFKTPLDLPVFEVVRFVPSRPYGDGVRTLELALCAAREALTQAGITPAMLAATRVGVCLGTTVASQLNNLEFYRSFKETGAAPMTSVLRYLKGNLADAVAAQLCPEAITLTVTNACSSGADAIAIGAQWIDAGRCDIVIAGGADELNRVPYDGFNALGLGCPFPCKPFDKNRKGLNLGEGAGVVILESQASASAGGRGSGLALHGYSSSCDAFHLTAPRPDGAGLRTALTQALACGDVRPEDIAFINAHGTGTQENDLVEGNTLAEIFGPTVPVLSTKGVTGHTLGAAGGLEAVFTGVGLREGWVPASVGFEEQDERIAITPLRKPTAIRGRFAVSTSLAFGGNNTALLIGLHE